MRSDVRRRHFHGRATHVRRASLNASRAPALPVAAAAAAGSSADRNGVLSCCSHHLQSSPPCAGIVSAARELDAYARRATCSKSCAGAGRGWETPAATARSTARGPYWGAHGRSSSIPTAASPIGAAEPRSARKKRPAASRKKLAGRGSRCTQPTACSPASASTRSQNSVAPGSIGSAAARGISGARGSALDRANDHKPAGAGTRGALDALTCSEYVTTPSRASSRPSAAWPRSAHMQVRPQQRAKPSTRTAQRRAAWRRDNA